jgi:hypothetical protein
MKTSSSKPFRKETSESVLQNTLNQYSLILNADRTAVFVGCMCTICNTIVKTCDKNHREKCKCLNRVTILGGLENPRIYADRIKFLETLVVYADQPYEKVRNYATRGWYGENYDKELKFITLSEMTDKFLEECIIQGGPKWHLELLTKEIQYRFTHKINVY